MFIEKLQKNQMNTLFNHPLYYIKAFKILYEKCKIYYVNEKVVTRTVLKGVFRNVHTDRLNTSTSKCFSHFFFKLTI